MKSIPNLKLALIQTALHWKDKTANFAMLEEKIWGIEDKVDLIILPEMFSTGFTMDASEMSEPMSSVEIEDVLSSIRRLVSEDLRPGHGGQARQAPSGRLLLTRSRWLLMETCTSSPERLAVT